MFLVGLLLPRLSCALVLVSVLVSVLMFVLEQAQQARFV
jgi:hypothetical protein